MPEPPADLFSPDYHLARARFIHAAATAGATLHTHVHPTARAPDGGSLSCDVAVLGDPRADKAFVAVAGTHGVEGYVGSAAHLHALQSGLAADHAVHCRIVLIHGINPYGFAHDSRTTENNVDLNRNFIDHDAPHPCNTLYADLHPIVCPKHYDADTHARHIEQLRTWTASHGQEARNQALIAGQYHFPDGKTYGGRAREWSNRLLEHIARAHLHGVRKVAFIDWHTGLGDYGEELFLCFNTPGSPEYEQCVTWWGRERIEANHGFEGASRPRYQGLLFDGMRQFVEPARFAGSVVEFGIMSNADQEAIFMLDHWLRFGHHAEVPEHTRTHIRERVRQAFTPVDPQWRKSVASRLADITAQALAGLGRW